MATCRYFIKSITGKITTVYNENLNISFLSIGNLFRWHIKIKIVLQKLCLLNLLSTTKKLVQKWKQTYCSSELYIMHFPRKKHSLSEIQTNGNEIVVHSNVNREQNKGNNLVNSWPESPEHKLTIKCLTLSRREAIWYAELAIMKVLQSLTNDSSKASENFRDSRRLWSLLDSSGPCDSDMRLPSRELPLVHRFVTQWTRHIVTHSITHGKSRKSQQDKDGNYLRGGNMWCSLPSVFIFY